MRRRILNAQEKLGAYSRKRSKSYYHKGSVFFFRTSCGTSFKVDARDAALVSGRGWRLSGRYVVTCKGAQLGRLLLDPPNHLEIDHKNRNPLDNRRNNLRLATPRQNVCNIAKQPTNRSGYKGVSFNKRCRKWFARVVYEGKHYYGPFRICQKKAFKDACKLRNRLHGRFACHD